MSIYCVYLTCYRGNKLPPFYIGYSTIEKVENGYKGTVKSQRYKALYQQELKDNPHLFKTHIISRCSSRKDALDREAAIQRHFRVHTNPMYINLAISNEKFFVEKHTDEYKERHRKIFIGRVLTEDWKRKIGNGNRGKVRSVEFRKHISEKQKGKKQPPRTEEHRKNLSKANTGKRHSQETKRKISDVQKGIHWWTDGTVTIRSFVCPPGFVLGRTINRN